MLPLDKAFVRFFMFAFLYILVYIQCLYIMFLFRHFSGTNVFSVYNIIIDIFYYVAIQSVCHVYYVCLFIHLGGN